MTSADEILKKISEYPVLDIPVADITSDGRNPNQMTPEQFAGLVAHIRDNGILNPLIITQSRVLADGEHRLRAAKQLGLTAVPARIIPDDEKLRRLLRQTMNKIRGTHNPELDAEEYTALIDLDGINELAEYLGADSGDLLKVLDQFATPEPEDPDDFAVDEAVAAVTEPQTKPGDMYRLGDHLLLCGDATKAEDWARLLADGEPAMMLTDPPYNVALGYSDTTKDREARHRRKDGLTIQNDSMTEAEFYQFMLDFLQHAMQHVTGAQYIFMSSLEWATLHRAFTDAGGHWSTTIIWVKTTFALSRRDYHPQHEPCYVGAAVATLRAKKGAKTSGQPILYGWKKGGTRQHYDRRVESDVWVADKPSRSEQHPTMKPVSLFRKAILMSSKPTDTVVDPFCGSGTTVIACEQTHRKARAIELDPKYCDVIIQRWEQFTGRKAEKL